MNSPENSFMEIPRYISVVTIVPEIITPIVNIGIAFFGWISKIQAASIPLHAPVKGNGIATNGMRPNLPYFDIIFFPPVFMDRTFNSKMKGIGLGNLSKTHPILWRIHGIKSTGIKFPIRPNMAA